MSLYLKIILILFGLAYLISPVDIIPDLLLPYVGWIDDGVVIFAIIHLIRYGELPWFFFRKKTAMGNSAKKKGWTPNAPGNTKSKGSKANKKNSSPGPASPGRPGRAAKNQDSPKKGPSSFKSAHQILGISATADWKEIQTAYKEKIKRYHPDKVSHLGEEFSDLANERFLEIQKAYEFLKTKSRN
jgi:hypothetical protein